MSAIFLGILRFALWEAVLFAAALLITRLIGWRSGRSWSERMMAVLAIEVTLESSFAAILSFCRMNSAQAYWIGGGCLLLFLLLGMPGKRPSRLVARLRSAMRVPWPPGLVPKDSPAFIAALFAPLVLLAFKPVEEIDSVNYLHFMIEWLSNRATPYTFSTNYVAFWELSFLPVWSLTGMDFFFPLLAIKAVVLMTLALWLFGRELLVPPALLLWAVFGCVAMQHYWYGPSGVATLKNDVLHGVGFVLMALVILRASRRPLQFTDIAILAFGIAFGAVKYTGIFAAALAVVIVPFFHSRHCAAGTPAASMVPASHRACHRSALWAIGCAAFFLSTSGHYYLHNFLEYGSPFYPFQINLGFVHLPGTADLSDTSILYNLDDPRLWRALFLPAGENSPAGLLFPLILAATLVISAARCGRAALAWLRARDAPSNLDWAAFFLLCGWMLYFRSVYSASAYANDLVFILNGLNSIRYVDGVLAASEIFLVALLARFGRLTAALVAVNLLSRLAMLYARLDLYPILALVVLAVLAYMLFIELRRRALAVAVVILMMLGPFAVERNRERRPPYWNDLEPALSAIRGPRLANLTMTDGGHFAGHVAAAGNPVNTAVRSFSPEQFEALAPGRRLPYLAVMPSPGSTVFDNWESRYGPAITRWGYRPAVRGKHGALFERASD